MNVAKGSIITFAAKMSKFVLQGLAVMIVARALGPEELGIATVALLYPNLFFTIGSLSLGVTYFHHFYKKSYTLEDFAGNSLFLSIILALGLAACFFLSYYLFGASLYKNVDLKYLGIAFLAVPFLLVSTYFSNILQCVDRITEYNYVTLWSMVVFFGFVLLLVVLLNFKVIGYIGAKIAGDLIAALLAVYWVLKVSRKRWRINYALMKVTLKDACKLHVASIATFLYTKVDLLMINSYLDSRNVGYYFIAVTVIDALLFIPIAVQTVLYPKAAASEHGEAEQVVARISKHAFYWSMLAGAATLILSNFIIHLIGGKDYSSALVPLLIMIPGMVLQSIPITFAALWIKKGLFTTLSWISVGTASLNILLNVILLPIVGINGAALATSVTYFATFVIILSLIRKMTDLELKEVFVITGKDISYYKDLFISLGPRSGSVG